MNRLYKTLMALELAAAFGAGLVGWTLTAQTAIAAEPAAAAAPAKPDVELRTDLQNINECVTQLLEYLQIHGADTAISI